jgi:hypothetical protein
MRVDVGVEIRVDMGVDLHGGVSMEWSHGVYPCLMNKKKQGTANC